MRGFDTLMVVSLTTAAIAQVVILGGPSPYPDFGISLPDSMCCRYADSVPSGSGWALPRDLHLRGAGQDGVAGPIIGSIFRLDGSRQPDGAPTIELADDARLTTNALSLADAPFDWIEFAATSSRAGGSSDRETRTSSAGLSAGVLDLTGAGKTDETHKTTAVTGMQFFPVPFTVADLGNKPADDAGPDIADAPADDPGNGDGPGKGPGSDPGPTGPIPIGGPPTTTGGAGVPEPASIALLATAMLGLAASRRGHRR